MTTGSAAGMRAPALIRVPFSTDGDRLLRGCYTGPVGSALLSAVAEATLLAAFSFAEPVFA